MGKLGRKRVEDELAWQYSVGNLLSAYNGALGGNLQRKPCLLRGSPWFSAGTF